MKNQIEKTLADIWSKYKGSLVGSRTYDRGFVYSIPKPSDILITGINPSDNGLPSHFFYFDDTNYPYFNKLKKIAPNAAYLDLFNIRGEQNCITEIAKLPMGLDFLADQLSQTQHLIENIVKPKLILVFNKGSWGYWGFDPNPSIVWMGYDFEFVKELEFGKLMRIKGLKISSMRISQDIVTTNLNDCLVYFSKYLNYTSNLTLEKIKNEIEGLMK